VTTGIDLRAELYITLSALHRSPRIGKEALPNPRGEDGREAWRDATLTLVLRRRGKRWWRTFLLRPGGCSNFCEVREASLGRAFLSPQRRHAGPAARARAVGSLVSGRDRAVGHLKGGKAVRSGCFDSLVTMIRCGLAHSEQRCWPSEGGLVELTWWAGERGRTRVAGRPIGR
jgi:hypothetical protein